MFLLLTQRPVNVEFKRQPVLCDGVLVVLYTKDDILKFNFDNWNFNPWLEVQLNYSWFHSYNFDLGRRILTPYLICIDRLDLMQDCKNHLRQMFWFHTIKRFFKEPFKSQHSASLQDFLE